MKPSKHFIIICAIWALATLLLVTSYGLVQQSYRSNANDPQIQLAEDGAAQISANNPPELLVGDSDIDLKASLAPAIIVYDDAGTVLVSDAKLNGKTPAIPSGVLEAAKLHGRNIITWQPTSGVRLAAVVVRNGGDAPGYVVAVRSLKEVEVRESAALNITVFSWLLATILIFGTAFLVSDTKLKSRKKAS